MSNPETKHVYLLVIDLQTSGIQRAFLRLALGLRAIGVRVTFVTCWDKGPLAEFLPPDIPVIVLKNHMSPRRSIALLAKYLRRDTPDALLSGDDAANACAVIAKALAFSKTRLVIGVHNSMAVKYKEGKDKNFRKLGMLLRYLLPRANRIVALNEGTKMDFAEFIGVPPERIEIINNPVIDREELEAKAAEPWQDEPFFGSKDPLILALGRMNLQKDFPNLLKAFALLLKKRPANLVIYGDGADRPSLEALVEQLGLRERVAMPGSVSNPYPALSRADVFALSSRFEGAPLVLSEAMFFNVPIVSTDCRWGPREILEDGKWGRLVPIENAEALADALIEALDEGRKPLPEESWAEFTVERSVAKYVNVLFN